jgi:hypothetical protein
MREGFTGFALRQGGGRMGGLVGLCVVGDRETRVERGLSDVATRDFIADLRERDARRTLVRRDADRDVEGDFRNCPTGQGASSRGQSQVAEACAATDGRSHRQGRPGDGAEAWNYARQTRGDIERRGEGL